MSEYKLFLAPGLGYGISRNCPFHNCQAFYLFCWIKWCSEVLENSLNNFLSNILSNSLSNMKSSTLLSISNTTQNFHHCSPFLVYLSIHMIAVNSAACSVFLLNKKKHIFLKVSLNQKVWLLNIERKDTYFMIYYLKQYLTLYD